ncbi:MAG: class I SAM-dependent methyltransferase [Pseudomonadota bacterium]
MAGTGGKRWRRARMMLETLLGRPKGFFSPYRYADALRSPVGYPSLEPRFAEAFARQSTGGLTTPADIGASIAEHAAALSRLDGPAPRPRWTQSWYPRLDGAAAYALLRTAPPARIIEVGSGHSTRFMAAAVADAAAPTRITCIDPQPRATLEGLKIDWQRRLLSPSDTSLFEALEPGDVAFFDSSHLLWPGSDVDLILNAILPALRPGVLIHLHDIFLPDAYPAHWEWRGYTEQLGLGGWLMGGGAEILWSSHYALTRAGADRWVGVEGLPLIEGAVETALWLIRR